MLHYKVDLPVFKLERLNFEVLPEYDVEFVCRTTVITLEIEEVHHVLDLRDNVILFKNGVCRFQELALEFCDGSAYAVEDAHGDFF